MKTKILLSIFLIFMTAYGYIMYTNKRLIDDIHVTEHAEVQNPRISVILPTLNRQELLPKAIDSILSQTYPDFELIVINDGSTDMTGKILNKYAQFDKRIKIITHQKNKGFAASVNEGIDHAQGEYIARLDDDDKSLPQRLEKQLQYMDEHPDVAIVGTLITDDDTLQSADFINETNAAKMKIQQYCGLVPVAQPSILIRKSFLDEFNIRWNGTYNPAEDLKLYSEVYDNGGKISMIPEVLVWYRVHHTNSDDYYARQKSNTQKIIKEMLSKLNYNGEVEDFCHCMDIVSTHNQDQILDDAAIAEIKAEKCRNYIEIKIETDKYQGTANRNLKYISANQLIADILEADGKKLKIKWRDDGLIEDLYLDTDLIWKKAE